MGLLLRVYQKKIWTKFSTTATMSGTWTTFTNGLG